MGGWVKNPGPYLCSAVAPHTCLYGGTATSASISCSFLFCSLHLLQEKQIYNSTGEESAQKTQPLLPSPAGGATVKWVHHFWRTVADVFQRTDNNVTSSGPWSSSAMAPDLGSFIWTTAEALSVRQPLWAKRPSEVRIRWDWAFKRTAQEPPLMAQHRVVVNTAARPPDNRKQDDRSYQDAFAIQIAEAASALICPSYNGFLS